MPWWLKSRVHTSFHSSLLVCLCKFLCRDVVKCLFSFAVSEHFLGPVAKSFVRRLRCLDENEATITYLPASKFINMRKYTYVYMSSTHFFPPLHTAFSNDSRYFSFRWSIHRYDHAAYTLTCFSSDRSVSEHTCAQHNQNPA